MTISEAGFHLFFCSPALTSVSVAAQATVHLHYLVASIATPATKLNTPTSIRSLLLQLRCTSSPTRDGEIKSTTRDRILLASCLTYRALIALSLFFYHQQPPVRQLNSAVPFLHLPAPPSHEQSNPRCPPTSLSLFFERAVFLFCSASSKNTTKQTSSVNRRHRGRTNIPRDLLIDTSAAFSRPPRISIFDVYKPPPSASKLDNGLRRRRSVSRLLSSQTVT
ncbi:hypothetical protein NM208_g16004 [Fusarium decemcellulare]|uniref:Uncharacterized protein n=1 Tax=Fusarium decemcellulare TaxID=57161 RepID=A0ACC1RCY0_9HYPO|nr:hypothetical protein NM208_g16004 [Fusarium decemcellulare]